MPGPKHPHPSPAGIHLKAFLLRASRSPTPTALALGPEHRAMETWPRNFRRKIIPQPQEGASHPLREPQLVVHHPHPAPPAPPVPGETPWGYGECWGSTFEFVGTDGWETRVQKFPKTAETVKMEKARVRPEEGRGGRVGPTTRSILGMLAKDNHLKASLRGKKKNLVSQLVMRLVTAGTVSR